MLLFGGVTFYSFSDLLNLPSQVPRVQSDSNLLFCHNNLQWYETVMLQILSLEKWRELIGISPL